MSAKEAEQELNIYYEKEAQKKYKKNDRDIFENTKSHLGSAIERAEKTWEKERERTCAKEDWRKKEKGSYTNVYELIKEIGVEVKAKK